jgi:hypothetical protein
MPTTATKVCPGCGEAVPSVWPKCKKCGALLIAPPTPLAPATPPEGSAPRSVLDDRFFAAATLDPVSYKKAPPAKKKGVVAVVLAVIALLVVGGGAYAFMGSDGGAGSNSAPVVMPPHGATNGLPSGLGEAVRIQAESTRQRAFSALAQVSAQGNREQIDMRMLEQMQPDLKWLPAGESSTGPKEVSMSQSGPTVTVAIAASNKTVCAFGKWQMGGVGEYVTMANMHSCKATDAPAQGWSTLAGGSSADLPPEGY